MGKSGENCGTAADESQNQERWSMKQRITEEKIISLRSPTYKGRVEHRSDILEDDSVSCAVFTEQGSSASQMTAAEIMDIISRLPRCAGQAADAVSAGTQVKMEDVPKLFKIPKLECPDIWIRLPRHKWPQSWSSTEDPVVPLERNLYGHPLAGLLWERQFEKILLKHGWEKVSSWECFFVHRQKWLFSSYYQDDIKLAGKKHNIDPMWNVLNKEVDLGEPTSFLYHACILRMHWKTMWNKQRYCGQLQIHVWFTSFRGRNWKASILWKSSYFFEVFFDMESHAKKCVERYCELANRTTQQLYKVSITCTDDHHFKE